MSTLCSNPPKSDVSQRDREKVAQALAEQILPYINRVIRLRAFTMIGSYGFTKSDRKDIEQDLWLDVLQRLEYYDPEKSSPRTFINRIIRNKVASIAEFRKASKRDYRVPVFSLDQPVLSGSEEENPDDAPEFHEFVGQDEVLFITLQIARSLVEIQDMKLDVNRVIEELSPNLQKICELLKEDSFTEVAEKLQIPRTTLYERRNQIRHYFEQRGLADYL